MYCLRFIRSRSVLASMALLAASITPGAVFAANLAPQISGSPPTWVYVGSQYSFRPSASDPERARLYFSIANKPSWASFNSATGQIYGTPQTVGLWSNIELKVSDGVNTRSLAFSIRATSANNVAPTISGSPATTATVDVAYSFQPVARDSNGDPLGYKISNRPSWANFDAYTGRLSGTPGESNIGTFSNISISATDGAKSAVLPAFSIVVKSAAATPNKAPTIAGTPATQVDVGSQYAFTPTASDPEGATLSYSIANKPAWASFNSSTGQLSGAPTASHAGTYSNIVISVSDGKASTSLPAFAINVAALPELTLSAARTDGTNAGRHNITLAWNPIANAKSYSVERCNGEPCTPFSVLGTPTSAQYLNNNLPSGLTFSYRVRAVVGSTYTNYSNVVSVTTVATNHAPTISGAPVSSAAVGQSYSFQPSASDADGDALGFSIQNRPVWATFSTSTGQLSGTPTTAHAGLHANIVISVSDGKTSVSLPAFAIDVAAPAELKLSAVRTDGTNAGRHNITLAWNPIANAKSYSVERCNGEPCTPFAVLGATTSTQYLNNDLPSGFTFSYRVRALVGSSYANYSNIASITTVAANRAPTISGASVASVKAGVSYSFRPTASDADGDPLTFSISNAPSWTNFSTSTGQLSGTPTTAQVGAYDHIVISVTDGKSTVSLPAFSIAVTQVSTGSATLSWAPSTQHTDGSACHGLAGYRVLYGTSANALNQSIDIPNGSVTTYVVENLAPGTYYFAVRGYMRVGEESEDSNMLMKVVQ